MARKVFFSFEYKPDNWRVSQVRSMGKIEGNNALSDNDWESVTKGGDAAIKRWIDNQISGTSCTIVLIGNSTAGRKWINYEIEKSWNEGKGLVGIYIHNLLNSNSKQCNKGKNPFIGFSVNKVDLSLIVKDYNPPFIASSNVYNDIKENIEKLVEDAIRIRSLY